MSGFPKIDPDHPICIAERALDQEAFEDEGIDKVTMRRFGDTLSLGELSYMAEQRALRGAAVLLFGEAAFEGGEMKESVIRKVMGSNYWLANRAILMSLYMDGLLVGWDARKISPW